MSDTAPQPRPPRHRMSDDDPRQGQPLRPHPPTPPPHRAPRGPNPLAQRPPRKRRTARDVAGVVLGALLLIGGGWATYDYNERGKCQDEQAAGLAAVQENIRARSSITQQQSEADQQLIRDLIATPDRDAYGKRAARQRWLDMSRQLAAQRADRPYPEVRSCQQ